MVVLRVNRLLKRLDDAGGESHNIQNFMASRVRDTDVLIVQTARSSDILSSKFEHIEVPKVFL